MGRAAHQRTRPAVGRSQKRKAGRNRQPHPARARTQHCRHGVRVGRHLHPVHVPEHGRLADARGDRRAHLGVFHRRSLHGDRRQRFERPGARDAQGPQRPRIHRGGDDVHAAVRLRAGRWQHRQGERRRVVAGVADGGRHAAHLLQPADGTNRHVVGQQCADVGDGRCVFPGVDGGVWGGGGLCAGVGTYVKSVSPQTKIIGAEPEGAPSMHKALQNGSPVTLPSIERFVDGASVKRVGELNFELCKAVLDDMLLVPEGKVCSTILQLYNEDAIVAEPAGALS
ncbi:MAG: pyridoxal-phosphate dependent enzyme, partial [Comamonadaceae bacterium]